MKIAVLTNWPNSVATTRLIEVAESRGHQAEAIKTADCYLSVFDSTDKILYKGKVLKDYDVVIPRFTHMATSYGSALVLYFELGGTFVTTGSQAILAAADKLRSLQLLVAHGVPVPKSAFAKRPKNVERLYSLVDGAPLVIKTLEGSQGLGVKLAKDHDDAVTIVQDLIERKKSFLFQKYIKESSGVDIRAFVVDGSVVAAMRRTGKDGEFRSNLHLGGHAESVQLTEEESRIAIKAAQALSLPICGVDILRSDSGPLVLEVNSAPGFEIEKVTGVDVASKILDFVEQKAKQVGKG